MYGSWKATLGNETIRLVNVLISLAPVTDEQRSAETRAITAGRDASGALFPPLHAASTWDAGSLDGTHAGAKAIHQVGFYSRYANPTVDAFERAIAELEGTESALAFASGMGAISSVIFGFCSTGDHIVAQRNMYAGTLGVLNGPCRRMGIDVTFVDGRNADEFVAAVRPGKTMLIVAESPSNPHLDLVDLEKLGAISGPITMIDSTVATPLGQRPADFGIDLVVHSATKGIAGHNDATLGVVAGSKDYIDALWSYSVLHGATASPHDALAGLRGLRTLPVRLDPRGNADAPLRFTVVDRTRRRDRRMSSLHRRTHTRAPGRHPGRPRHARVALDDEHSPQCRRRNEGGDGHHRRSHQNFRGSRRPGRFARRLRAGAQRSSLKMTCLRTTGSYFFSSRRSREFTLFLRVTYV